MKKRTVQSTVKCSSVLITLLINCMRWNLSRQKLSIENQSLWVFFILQYAKLRVLELYYNFFRKFCDSDKYEELEMDTDSLYLALSEESLEDVIVPEKRAEWDQLRSINCTDEFTANATDNFSPELAVTTTRNMIRESRVYLKKNLDV